MPLLIQAIRLHRFKQVQLALEVGWNVNERDPENFRTPLMELSFIDREAMAIYLCKRFLDKGAKIGLRDKEGRNAFLHACFKSRVKLIEIMLKEDGLNLNDRDRHGNTALHLAVASDNIVIVRLLLKELKRYKLSVDVCNNFGETPLILASQIRKFLISEILISEGNACTEIRDTKRHLTAKEWESVKIMKMTEGGFSILSSSRKKHPFQSNGRSSTLEIRPHLDRPRHRSSLKIVNSSYKREFNKLFDIYHQQISTTYRPSAIPPKPKDNGEVSDMSEYDAYYTTCALDRDGVFQTCPIVPLVNKKRLTISKAVQIPLSSKNKRRQSLASSVDKAKNAERGNITSRQEPQTMNFRRGSINVFQKLQVPVKKRHSSPLPRQKTSTLNEQDEMMSLFSKLDVLTEVNLEDR